MAEVVRFIFILKIKINLNSRLINEQYKTKIKYPKKEKD